MRETFPSLGFEHPLALLLLPLAFLPFLFQGPKAIDFGAFALLPEDPLSRTLSWVERSLSTLFLLALLLALSAPYLRTHAVWKAARGSTIILLIDRSSSMNEDFSGQYLAGKSRETKMVVARTLLSDFVRESRDHLFGLIGFSTAPVEVAKLTSDRRFLQAAISALPDRGRGATYLAPALLLALSRLREAPPGKRIVLLISDGATQIEPEARATMAQLFRELDLHLYWLYLRSRHAPSLIQPNARSTVSPAFALHQFFETLGDHYRLFETENRETLARALEEVHRLSQAPFRYREIHPRFRLERGLLLFALALLLLLLPLRLLEQEGWS